MLNIFIVFSKMTTRSQLGWQKLLPILTVLPCCWSLQVSIAQNQYKVAKGKDITLTCSFQPAVPIENKFLLTWEAHPDVPGNPLKTVASFFLNSPVDIAPAYEGRVSMEVNIASGTSTLHFTKVSMEDSRTFQCSVKIPNDDEGTTAASTFLLVLEPPSPPICKLKGTAEYFNNISLTCQSEEGSPPPVYQWTSYSIENIPRQFPPKATQKDGVLSLFNISRETSGFFVCTSENEIASAKCNFTLAVMPASMSMGSTGFIIGGVLAGVVVVGILIFCCCRRKGKKDKHTEGSPGEMEFYDKDSAETGRPYLDDKSSSERKQADQYEDKDVPQSSYSMGAAERKFDDDQHSYISGKEKYEGKGSDIGSQRYPDDQHNSYRGSRDRLDDNRDRYGSRDRLDDNRDRYGSRDRLDDNRDRYGSRDRLDDNRDRNGSRDRLDDNRDRNGSRDRLDDNRDRYGSRDRLDHNRDRYGSRDRLDDNRDRYGSRDRLDDNRDRYGSRDRLDDNRDRYGSRDRLDDNRRHYGSRDRLDDRQDH